MLWFGAGGDANSRLVKAMRTLPKKRKNERHVVPKIPRHPIQSSVLRSIGYDGAHAVLEVEFVTKLVYRYHAVPQRAWRELMGAGSKGSYFNNHIRDKYPTSRVA
jgi:hypothetical protein